MGLGRTFRASRFTSDSGAFHLSTSASQGDHAFRFNVHRLTDSHAFASRFVRLLFLQEAPYLRVASVDQTGHFIYFLHPFTLNVVLTRLVVFLAMYFRSDLFHHAWYRVTRIRKINARVDSRSKFVWALYSRRHLQRKMSWLADHFLLRDKDHGEEHQQFLCQFHHSVIGHGQDVLAKFRGNFRLFLIFRTTIRFNFRRHYTIERSGIYGRARDHLTCGFVSLPLPFRGRTRDRQLRASNQWYKFCLAPRGQQGFRSRSAIRRAAYLLNIRRIGVSVT